MTDDSSIVPKDVRLIEFSKAETYFLLIKVFKKTIF